LIFSDEYILNGKFVMSQFRKTIQYGGITLEYSGSDTPFERVNSSKPLKKDLVVEVKSFKIKKPFNSLNGNSN
jgi:thrombospondin motif-containing protein 9